MLKSADRADGVAAGLTVVVLVAIVEALGPRVGRVELRRGPVVAHHESSNSYLLQIQSIKLIFRWQEPIALSAAVIGGCHICSTVCTTSKHHLAI